MNDHQFLDKIGQALRSGGLRLMTSDDPAATAPAQVQQEAKLNS